MVDARKSIQASGQARDAAGRFKDENESSLGELPVPDDVQREVDTAVAHVATLVSADPDTAEFEPWLSDRLSTLTAGASMSGEDDRDVRLIAANIQYDPDGPGGSRSDYLSSHVLEGFDGCNLEVPDHDALVAETKANILSTAFDPERAYESLGLEYTAEDRQLYADQHQQRQDDDRRWREVAYRLSDKGRRETAGMKGAASAAANRETRQAAAIEKHVGPLDERMQTIYRQNVDKGLQHGSPFDDRMAFADALHELQDDGWNPEAGKAYRSSKEFRKLEKQLLAGRRSTRRYRQLRDALCDNEQEYKRFMTANPDVFDPDEKIVKPFAGLGSTVGQQAMLRLAAKHRGVDGALRLARRDPDIDYVVGDTGSKTYRVEHHHPYTTYDDTTGVHTTHDSPISANGIKPASVMGWIHGERVNDPKNRRERVRFEEAFGGEWRPADV